MIDLTLLNRALAVAEAGSFAGAAKSLGLSQPTLSRQIAALELALGFRLFDRGRQGAIPTPLGNQVLTRASSLVQSAALLDHEIDLLRGVTIGELKVGAGVYPAYMSLGRALGRLSASHPGLRVSVTVGDWRTMADEVLEARLDLAIAELSEHIETPSLQLEPLPAHPAAFVCRPGHPLLDMPDPSLVDIFKYPFAGTRLAPRVAALLADMETAGTIDGTTGEYIPSITVNTLRMAAEVVSESDAFGIFPLSLIDPLMQPGHLQALSFQPPWLKSGYGFITLRDRTLSPAAAAFMREVRVVESEIGAEEKRILEARDQALPRQTTPSKSTIPRKRARKS